MTYIDDPYSVEKLLAIMQALRDPQAGCPWDIKQTFETIAPYTVEEVYEVCDAIARNDMGDLKEELGDLLLQIVFHSQMACEQNHFDFHDVVDSICEKMLRRHPHVFDQAGTRDADSVLLSWEKIKHQERLQKGYQDHSIMAGIAAGMPPLQRAIKLQKQAATAGFDWRSVEGVRAKLHEELDELWAAYAIEKDHDRVCEEFGDLLFTMVNLARHLKVDSGQCLHQANIKFESRFRGMEKLARQEGVDLSSLSPEDWDRFWENQKQ